MAISLSVITASFFARPLMSELWHWYALSFFQYVGYSGAAMMCAGKLVGMWFQRSRGRAMGVTAMGNNFGGILFPPMMGAILTLTSDDWRAVYLALGAMSVGLVAYTLAATRDFPSAEELGDELLDKSAGGGSPMTGMTLGEALRGTRFLRAHAHGHARILHVLGGDSQHPSASGRERRERGRRRSPR